MNMLQTLRQRFGALASASLVLMISMTVVNAGNYVYNLIMGRWLGPAQFADVSLMVTLLLVITFLTLPLQLTMARYAAIYADDADQQSLAAVRRLLVRVALGLGLALAAVFSLGAPLWKSLFGTASILPFILFGIGLPFALLQCVDRGILQGRTQFTTLALTYQTEMWSRLISGLVLVALGMGVNGAVLGISISFFATWLSTYPARKALPAPSTVSNELKSAALSFAVPIMVAQIGQIMINNSDILLVRLFYPAQDAGQYAALALIGRIVFFATWSVVTTMFPIVAQRHKRGQPHRFLMWASLGIVAGIALPVTLAALTVPELIVRLLFGARYLAISSLLWLYAIATTLYALANVVINYRLSLGLGRQTVFAIAAGIAQIIGIGLFHQTLAQVVWVQVVAMAGLFLIMLLWDLVSQKRLAPPIEPLEVVDAAV